LLRKHFAEQNFDHVTCYIRCNLITITEYLE
jgi:hypothetical protein